MTTQLSNGELLARLVGFDSTSCNSNLPLADFICDYLDRPGILIERVESQDHHKVDLVVTVSSHQQGERRGLALSGHMDVVPADEPGWTSAPFELTRRGDRLYGRGACDMKGFLALAINAAVKAVSRSLHQPLVLILTYDEEIGLLGAKHLAESWTAVERLPRAAIIGEPTELLVIRMHKGYLDFRIAIQGLSAHSGYPHLGRSAIEPAGRLVVALSELRRTFEAESPPNREHFPEVPFAALNIGRVGGGSATNVIPDHCNIECALRLLPGMDQVASVGRVRETVETTLDGIPHSFELGAASPAMYLSDDAEIYRALCSEIGQTETLSASYATDAAWLQRLDMQCVIWGPGSIEVAHKPDESIPIEQMERADLVLGNMIRRFCAG
jgi:acetylornithine deacetylase